MNVGNNVETRMVGDNLKGSIPLWQHDNAVIRKTFGFLKQLQK